MDAVLDAVKTRKTDLHDVTGPEDFAGYYEAHGLLTVEEKINYLTKAMKIRATRGGGEETPEEALADLEEFALLGFWKASW